MAAAREWVRAWAGCCCPKAVVQSLEETRWQAMALHRSMRLRQGRRSGL